MKKQCIFLLLALIAASGPSFGAEHDIIISRDNHHTGSRTIPEQMILCTYDNVASSLYFDFGEVCASRIIIHSTMADTPLILQTCLNQDFLQVDISSLIAGEYAVEIYAFNIWWIGYFEIE